MAQCELIPYSNEYIHNITGFSDNILIGIVLTGQKQQWNATLTSFSFSILLADDDDKSNKIFSTTSCDKKERNTGLYKIFVQQKYTYRGC